jgi:hypothetical protein
MREPSIAVALLQLFCRDEALVGDILEEYDHRQSRAWLWRQVGVAVMLGLPYGMVRRERTGQKMPMPIGTLGAVAVALLITIVAPGAWWLIGLGACGGVLLAVALVAISRRRVLREPAGRRNILLPVLLLAVAVPHAARGGQAPVPAVPIDPVEGIVAAFKTHQVVMLPGGHGNKRGYDLLLKILRDPRIQGTVNDVVVEFGTSRWQDLIDRFVRGDDGIRFAQLKHAWQDTTIPSVTNEGPYVEEFYRSVRALNADLPEAKRYRVLGGDPPIDWDNIVTPADLRKWTVRRDTFAADVIHREVIERGRRALVVYGQAHFPRREVRANYDMSNWQAQTMTSLLEAAGIRPFVIQTDSGPKAIGLQPDIASWPVTSLTLVRGTVLGAADFTVFNGDNDRFAIRGVDDFVKLPKEQYKPMRMEDMADAILWNGVTPPPTPILLSKETCADPDYLPMRFKRMTIAGLSEVEANAVRKACGVQ